MEIIFLSLLFPSNLINAISKLNLKKRPQHQLTLMHRQINSVSWSRAVEEWLTKLLLLACHQHPKSLDPECHNWCLIGFDWLSRLPYIWWDAGEDECGCNPRPIQFSFSSPQFAGTPTKKIFFFFLFVFCGWWDVLVSLESSLSSGFELHSPTQSPSIKLIHFGRCHQ